MAFIRLKSSITGTQSVWKIDRFPSSAIMVYNQVGNLQVDDGGGVLDPLTPQKFLDHVDEPRLHGQVDHRFVETDLEKSLWWLHQKKRWYPIYPKIPGKTKEYPEMPKSKKIPENTWSYNSTLLPTWTRPATWYFFQYLTQPNKLKDPARRALLIVQN